MDQLSKPDQQPAKTEPEQNSEHGEKSGVIQTLKRQSSIYCIYLNKETNIK